MLKDSITYTDNVDKTEKYKYAIEAIRAVCEGEKSIIANMANTTAILRTTFQWWWVGFYLVEGNDLVLGPFQGPVACTRIQKGKGVCGTAWQEARTVVVPDVHQFPGHIACSEESKSEIVVPVFRDGSIIAVLDVDSEFVYSFDHTDEEYLGKIVALI